MMPIFFIFTNKRNNTLVLYQGKVRGKRNRNIRWRQKALLCFHTGRRIFRSESKLGLHIFHFIVMDVAQKECNKDLIKKKGIRCKILSILSN